MTRKKVDTGQNANIKVGNISGVSGEVNIAGRDIEIHHTATGLSAAEIKQLFGQITSAIDIRGDIPPADKSDLKAEVQEIQSNITEAVGTQKQVDEGFLARHFRNIARMAPDILDVVVATLANPLAGVGVAVKKIADMAKESTK